MGPSEGGCQDLEMKGFQFDTGDFHVTQDIYLDLIMK